MRLSRFEKGTIFLFVAMVPFTVSRWLLWREYPESFATLDSILLYQGFANGLRFDASVVIRLFALPLLLLWLPFKWADRPVWFNTFAWLLYPLTLAMVLVLIGDVIYYGHVQRHIAYELPLLKNDIGFLIAFAIKAYPVVVAAYFLFAAALFALWCWLTRIPFRRSRYAGGKFAVLVVLLVIVGRGGIHGKVIEIIDAYGNGNTAYGNLSLNGVFTATVFALNLEEANHHFFPREQAVAIVDSKEAMIDSNYPMLRRYEGKPTGYNVIFVLLESWNFDYVDSFGAKDYGATPNFDALAADGLRFTRFYAAGQRSIEGIQATLTGIPVLKGLPRIDAGIGVSTISRLGSLAQAQGYHTLFIQSSARDSFKVSGIASASGFQDYYGREDIPIHLDYPDVAGAIFGWDYEMLQLMKEKLDRLPRPFLAYAFTGTTHAPFPHLPSRFEVRPHGVNDENGYLNALRYADWSLGQFMSAARKSPWFDNTVFIFTADHTNRFQKGSGLLQRFHTPFLIYAPGIFPAGERRDIGSQLDVMPTIIDILGLNGEFAALGTSLLRKVGGGEAFITVGGQSIGLVTDEAYIRHNLQRCIEKHGPKHSVEGLERRLLALDQLSFELLQSNHWAR